MNYAEFLALESLAIAGLFDLLADNSSEFKFSPGFWTKADTWEKKKSRRGPFKHFDGWHLLKGRRVDFCALSAAIFWQGLGEWTLVYAVVLRVLFSAFQGLRLKRRSLP